MRETLLRTSTLLTVMLGFLLAPSCALSEDKSGYTLFNPAPRELMRDLATDRPDKTESPISVDAGHFQHETDLLNVSIDRAGGETETSYLFAAPNLKVGLTNDIDLQFVMETLTYTSSSGKKVSSGNGDLTTRLKINLWGNDGGSSALAIMPYIKIPINYKNVGNDEVEGGLIVPLGFDLTGSVGLCLMTQYDLVDTPEGSGHDVQFVNSATIGADLFGNVGGYFEVWTSALQGRTLETTLDVGLTYAWNETTQLDIGINTGVSDAADDLNPFIGISQVF